MEKHCRTTSFRRATGARLLAPVFALSVGGAAWAQVPGPSPDAVNLQLQLRLVYWECLDPLEEPPCVSGTKDPDERKNECGSCKRWREVGIAPSLELAFQTDRFSYDTGPARASQFISEAATQLYGEAAVADGLRISELWEEPERLGWVEVDPGEDLVGTVAVWPGIAGVVVEQGVEGASGRAVVLYPSDRQRGELATTEVRFMDPNVAPKFLIPRALLEGVQPEEGG